MFLFSFLGFILIRDRVLFLGLRFASTATGFTSALVFFVFFSRKTRFYWIWWGSRSVLRSSRVINLPPSYLVAWNVPGERERERERVDHVDCKSIANNCLRRFLNEFPAQTNHLHWRHDFGKFLFFRFPFRCFFSGLMMKSGLHFTGFYWVSLPSFRIKQQLSLFSGRPISNQNQSQSCNTLKCW